MRPHPPNAISKSTATGCEGCATGTSPGSSGGATGFRRGTTLTATSSSPDPANPDLDPTDDPRYAGVTLTQDSDVFDTWFSSNLWPLLGARLARRNRPVLPEVLPDFGFGHRLRHPLFLGNEDAARRVRLAERKSPFTDIVLHGLVLDEHGQKMSKSKGNGIDPLSGHRHPLGRTRCVLRWPTPRRVDRISAGTNARVEMGRKL